MPMRMLASPAEPRHWLARVPMCYAECVVPWHAHWVTQGSVRHVRAFAKASVKSVNALCRGPVGTGVCVECSGSRPVVSGFTGS